MKEKKIDNEAAVNTTKSTEIVKVNKATPVKKKNPNGNIFQRMGKALKGMASELKKVTWPSGKSVVSNTGVVLAVVLLFLVVVTAMDLGLSSLLSLLTK